MSHLNRYFDKIFCINLDRRADKWDLSTEEFRKHDITVERFSAVDGSTINVDNTKTKMSAAEMGCAMSHVAILKLMIANKWGKVLILEDDVEFIPEVQNFFKDNEPLIPKNWDMLYFGGNHLHSPVMANKTFAKISRTFTTSHYAITLKMATEILERIEKYDMQIDVMYATYQHRANCYTFRPAIAWQKPGYSDIQNGYRDYTAYIKK